MKDINCSNRCSRENGFTIIELMVATVVFSVILLLVTYGILQIGRSYSKGVTESKTQNVARAIMDSITQDIQFYKSGTVIGAASGSTYVICVGNNRYTAFLGQELTDTLPNHALLYDANLVGGCSTAVPATLPLPPGSTSVELLSPHMRVSAIDVAQVLPLNLQLYTVHVRVAYGEDSVLDNPTGLNASCQGGSVNQFCAVSDLKTTIQKRVN